MKYGGYSRRNVLKTALAAGAVSGASSGKLQADPKELTGIVNEYPDVVRGMAAKMKEYPASGEGITLGSFNERPSSDRFRRNHGGSYAKCRAQSFLSPERSKDNEGFGIKVAWITVDNWQ
jgi:hypothetical protein